MMDIDPSWLNDSIAIKQILPDELDDYQNQKYVDPVTIDHVRVDLNTIWQGTGDNREVVGNGTVYMYLGYTAPFLYIKKSWLNSIITYDGEDYLLKNIGVLPDISGGVWSIELVIL